MSAKLLWRSWKRRCCLQKDTCLLEWQRRSSWFGLPRGVVSVFIHPLDALQYIFSDFVPEALSSWFSDLNLTVYLTFSISIACSRCYFVSYSLVFKNTVERLSLSQKHGLKHLCLHDHQSKIQLRRFSTLKTVLVKKEEKRENPNESQTTSGPNVAKLIAHSNRVERLQNGKRL
jgi:hypothetical protein